jgi:hypothetical protein
VLAAATATILKAVVKEGGGHERLVVNFTAHAVPAAAAAAAAVLVVVKEGGGHEPLVVKLLLLPAGCHEGGSQPLIGGCQNYAAAAAIFQAVVKEGGGPERLVVKLGMEKAAMETNVCPFILYSLSKRAEVTCHSPYTAIADAAAITQAVVKEGGGPERLVVKLGMEKAAKGNPDFARRMLGLMADAPNAAAAGMRPGQGQPQEGECLVCLHKGVCARLHVLQPLLELVVLCVAWPSESACWGRWQLHPTQQQLA